MAKMIIDNDKFQHFQVFQDCEHSGIISNYNNKAIFFLTPFNKPVIKREKKS